jgi:hypothetical protein
MNETERQLLKHFLATLVYRLTKSIKNADKGFWNFQVKEGVRTPHQLVVHIINVLGYAKTSFIGGTFRANIEDVESDLKKFYTIVQELDELIGKEEFKEIQPKNLLQGPLSDSMTHIGQIAMLRRIFGSPIPPENFVFANISSNNLSRNQSEPTAPDKKWFDADGKEQKEAL